MYKLAIFDFDGTLADSADWFVSALNAAAERFGYRPIADHELDTLRGLPNREIIRRLGVRPWQMPAIARHLRFEAGRAAGAFRLFPGALEALAALSERGIGIAIVSSNAEATVRDGLGPGAAGLVSFYGCGVSLFGKAKMLRRLVRASGVPPCHVIAIGDEGRDIEAARRAGVTAGAVSWGYAARAALAAAGPDILFDSFAQLVETVGTGAGTGSTGRPLDLRCGSAGFAAALSGGALLV